MVFIRRMKAILEESEENFGLHKIKSRSSDKSN